FWMNVVQTTQQGGNTVTNYVIGNAVVGTIGGDDVVSSQTARQIPGKPSNSSTTATFDAVFGKICAVMGLIVGCIMIYDFVSRKYAESQAKKQKANKDPNEPDDDFQENLSDELIPEFESPAVQATIANAQQVEVSYKEITVAKQREVVRESIQKEKENLENEIERQVKENGDAPNPEVEDAVNSLNQAMDQANKGNLNDAAATMKDAAAKVNKVIAENGDSDSKSLEESSKALEQAAKESASLDKAGDDYSDNMNNESDDGGYDSDSGTPEVTPIDGGEMIR
ncbi:MAG TPA: hypothetical protein VIX17_28485, partial [Pyrinomonadaceae bacterium]